MPPCSSYANCKPIARITNTLKLWGVSEERIMQEIYMHGPVQVSWNPPVGFSAYKSGTLTQVDIPKQYLEINIV